MVAKLEIFLRYVKEVFHSADGFQHYPKIVLSLGSISCAFLDNYLPPAAEGRGWEIIKRLLYVRTSVHLSVRPFVTFLHKP